MVIDLRPPLPAHINRLVLAARRIEANFPWAVKYSPETGGSYIVRPRQKLIELRSDNKTPALNAFALALLLKNHGVETRDRDGISAIPVELAKYYCSAREALKAAMKGVVCPDTLNTR